MTNYFNNYRKVTLEEDMIDIPQYKKFSRIELINKGFSNDQKYYIETIDNQKLLLRLADISEYERKQEEFQLMKDVKLLDIAMSCPIDFGICNNGKNVYSLFTWCDGIEAREILPSLSEVEQYQMGIKAGQMLKQIHLLPAPKNQEEWATRFNRKTDGKIARYQSCGIKLPGDQEIINYIKSNRNLFKNRPQCYQHGDYHVGNMIIAANKQLAIIDFNRCDYGDPWEEFSRIVWSATISSHFASGQIMGYFDDYPPLKFFQLLAFYIASNTLSSIYWAIPYGKSEIDIMIKQSEDILSWFDNMKNPIPTWFIKNLYYSS